MDELTDPRSLLNEMVGGGYSPRYRTLILGIALLVCAPIVGGSLFAVLRVRVLRQMVAAPGDPAEPMQASMQIAASAGGALALGGVLALVHWFFVARRGAEEA